MFCRVQSTEESTWKMALSTQEDAGTKFWRMPELVEKLLEYLDEISILSIVGVKLLTVEVLQTASGASKRFESKPLGKLFRKALGFGQPQTLGEQRTKVQRISSCSRFLKFSISSHPGHVTPSQRQFQTVKSSKKKSKF